MTHDCTYHMPQMQKKGKKKLYTQHLNAIGTKLSGLKGTICSVSAKFWMCWIPLQWGPNKHAKGTCKLQSTAESHQTNQWDFATRITVSSLVSLQTKPNMHPLSRSSLHLYHGHSLLLGNQRQVNSPLNTVPCHGHLILCRRMHQHYWQSPPKRHSCSSVRITAPWHHWKMYSPSPWSKRIMWACSHLGKSERAYAEAVLGW